MKQAEIDALIAPYWEELWQVFCAFKKALPGLYSLRFRGPNKNCVSAPKSRVVRVWAAHNKGNDEVEWTEFDELVETYKSRLLEIWDVLIEKIGLGLDRVGLSDGSFFMLGVECTMLKNADSLWFNP